MMPRYYVVTPPFEWMDVICDGRGPIETVCDVIEIEADTPRDAKALGVKVMLQTWYGKGERYRWCRDQRADGLSPYAGVKVFPVEAEGHREGESRS